MQDEILLKIVEAEEKLGYRFPASIRNLLLNLDDFGRFFGKEEWYFDIYNDTKNQTNTIVEDSLSFREDWKLEGIVFAQNGMGDHLLLLPKQYPQKLEGQLDEIIFVFWHELGEVRIFAYDLAEALDEDFDPGPEGDDFVYRIDEEDRVEEGFELRRIYDPVAYLEYLKKNIPAVSSSESDADPQGEEWLRLHERVNEVSDWVSEENAGKLDEMLSTLNECLADEFLGPRAHWLLSKIYMKGIGLPVNTEKGIHHVEQSAKAGNYTAMADLAFYYFKVVGVSQSTLRAIEWMESANEKSEGLLESELEALKNSQIRKN